MTESTTTADTNKVKKPSYTPAEEIQLCNSWIAISVDASVGTDQSRDTLWDRILDHFLASEKAAEKRTAHGLMQHWSRIQAATSNYVESISRAVALSGESTMDMHDRIAIIHVSQYGSAYKYPHCWSVLGKCEKWKEYNRLGQEKKTAAAKKKKEAMANVVEIEDEAEGEDQDVEDGHRPGGRDAAKSAKKRKAKQAAIETAEDRYAKRMSTYDEHDRNVLAELKRGNDIAAIQAKVAQTEQDMKIMSMDLSGLDSSAKAYFSELKAQIAERLMESN